MTLKELINLIFEEYDYYPYLLRIMSYITKKLNLKQINDINKKIIDSKKIQQITKIISLVKV